MPVYREIRSVGSADTTKSGGLSRRSFNLGALAIGGFFAVSACSSDKSGPSAETKPRKGGTLRVGITGGTDTGSTNPIASSDFFTSAFASTVYNHLVTMGPNGETSDSLAEELTPNADATEWTLRLRSGVQFHNGKPLTVDDVIYTIHQILDPANGSAAGYIFEQIDVPNIKKVDDLTMKLPCKSPYSTFYDATAINIFSIIPTDFDPKKPVGTGPFKFVSFDAGKQFTTVRNEKYWETDAVPYLDGVTVNNFADETSLVNALLGGQLDAAGGLTIGSQKAAQGGGMKTTISKSAGFNAFPMRTDKGPFADKRVRQAMALTLDRPQILENVFAGHGKLGNDLLGIDTAEYDSSIPQRSQDIDQAKFLLKRAGAENLSVELTTADFGPGIVDTAAVIAEQAKAAGIRVKINQLSTTTFLSGYTTYPFAIDVWPAMPWFPLTNLTMLPTSPANAMRYNNAKFNKLYAQAQATVDKTKRNEISHQMQAVVFDDTPELIPVFYPVIDAMSKKVNGAIKSTSGQPFDEFNFKKMWLTS